MKQRLALALSLALAAAPAWAQSEDENGRSKMEEGLQLFMDGLRQEMAPAMDGLRDFADQMGPSMRSFFQEMGPALADMMDEVKDWTRYYPPEMLPNGDIIIRRRPEPEKAPEEAPKPEQDGEPPVGATDI